MTLHKSPTLIFVKQPHVTFTVATERQAPAFCRPRTPSDGGHRL